MDGPGLRSGEGPMKTQFKTSRRSVLAGMTAVAGSLTLGRSAWGMLDGAISPNPGNLVWSLNPGYGDAGLAPFSMAQVRLLDGICKQQAEINQSYLDSLKTDRLLHSFRLTAGLTSNRSEEHTSELQSLRHLVC